MRLSDARLRRRQTKLVYLNHRLPPWVTEATSPRDRSNRLLEGTFISTPSCNPDNESRRLE
jgi:hypothetical protein